MKWYTIGQKFHCTRSSLSTAYKMEIVSSWRRPCMRWNALLFGYHQHLRHCSLVSCQWQEMDDRKQKQMRHVTSNNPWNPWNGLAHVTSLPSLKDLTFLGHTNGRSHTRRNTCTLYLHHTYLGYPPDQSECSIGRYYNGSEILVCVTCWTSQYSQIWSQKMVLMRSIMEVLLTALRSHLLYVSVVHSNS